jgi:serine/threonine-protein phosphatase 2A regulatory subunit B'
LSQFHQQLAYCATQFIDKDPSLAGEVIQGLFNYWPVQSSAKELLFLNELDEVLEITSIEELTKVSQPLFGQISKSIKSPHFQVAERALFLWNNDTVASFTSDHRKTILPILYPSLAHNSKNHWNQTVHNLTFNIIKMFMDQDQALFNSVSEDYEKQKQVEEKAKQKRQDFWTEFTSKK